MFRWQQIIDTLSQDEEMVLIKFAKEHASQNKAVPYQKIKMALPRRLRGNINSILKSLIKKQLIKTKKKGYYVVTQDGLHISQILKRRNLEEIYPDLRVLIIF